MGDRKTELRTLASRLREHDSVHDAFLAKSFTDRLVVVDVGENESLPPEIHELLAEHDLRGANEVYGDGEERVSFAGAVGEAIRHQFVDLWTRGDHQSYVHD
jgi:hypothetical protein